MPKKEHSASGETITPVPHLTGLSEFVQQVFTRLDALEAKTQAPSQLNFPESPCDINDAAKTLHLSRSRVYTLCNQNKLPYHKRGGKLYFFRSELLNCIRSGNTQEVKS
jgi:hypothetical protein